MLAVLCEAVRYAPTGVAGGLLDFFWTEGCCCGCCTRDSVGSASRPLGVRLRLRERPRTRSVMAPKKARVADELPAADDVCVLDMIAGRTRDQLISLEGGIP